MIQQTRLKRPKLERTGPIRNLNRAFNQNGADAKVDAQQRAPSNDEGLGVQDAVAEGVRIGYGVIEDQIRQAQNLAKTFTPDGGSLNMGGDEIRPLLTRMLRTYGDLTSVWLEVLNAAMGNVELLDMLLGKSKDDTVEPEKHEAAPNTTTKSTTKETSGISLRITANCPVETKLDLFAASSANEALVVQDLRCREAGKPPLSDVVMQQTGFGEPCLLSIKVPDQQPSGLYQGLIVDSRTDAPVGALSVTIHP